MHSINIRAAIFFATFLFVAGIAQTAWSDPPTTPPPVPRASPTIPPIPTPTPPDFIVIDPPEPLSTPPVTPPPTPTMPPEIGPTPNPTVPPVTPPPTPTIPPVVTPTPKDPGPTPFPTPWQPPATPTIPPILPTPPPVNQAESIPVVIEYGQGRQTSTIIQGGVMEPVGVPRAQSVTVTLFLPPAHVGQVLSLGLYDGGRFGRAAPPGSDMVAFQAFEVAADGVVQFNFKAGRLLGLYRAVVNLGPDQYLLQFYAVTPRPASDLPPLATATVSPHGTPHPSPPQ